MRKRIIFDVIILSLVFCTPWWLVFLLVIIGAYIWPSYYEIIVVGMLLDVLYGGGSLYFGGLAYTVSSLIIYFIVSYIRLIVR